MQSGKKNSDKTAFGSVLDGLIDAGVSHKQMVDKFNAIMFGVSKTFTNILKIIFE